MTELSNKARIGEAFDLLARGLEPFVERHMQRTTPKGKEWDTNFVATSRKPERQYSTTDPSFLLNVMIECWDGVFRSQLPRSTRNLLFTLRDKRNDWAHNRAIQPHDAQFTLSGILTGRHRRSRGDPARPSRQVLELSSLQVCCSAREKQKVDD